MDFLCNKCAKSSARKSILWFINQEHMTNVTFLARCVRKTSLGKTSTETTWESTTRRRKLPKNPHMFILPLQNTIQMVPHQTCQDSRHMTKKRFMGHPSSALNVENQFLPKHLKIHQSLFSFNMSGYFVVVGDLLVVPLGPFPLDTLINFWLPLDPLPASSLSNYSLPIDFVYNNLDQAFWFYSKAWINDKERFILLFMNWQTTRSPWL